MKNINKEQAIKELKELQLRVDNLTTIINKEESLFDTIKTYKDVYNALGEDKANNPYDKIKQLERLFNGEWKPNWRDSNQSKWYPYFTTTSSGSLVFSDSDYFYDCFAGQVGFYKDRETSNYIGKQFSSIYEELI